MHTPIFSTVVYNTINLYETLYKIKMILEIDIQNDHWSNKTSKKLYNNF